ncbi:MAG: hypothetical protein NC899_09110 [Candidatus Omnitrophica bacterium]|nr:hypothetical protein [Candidatus Omnitrophota bacterium]
MEIKVFEEETSVTRYIPFCLTIRNKEYNGIFKEEINSIGGMEDYFFEIIWDDKPPKDIDEEELIDEILKKIRGQ